MKIPSHWPQHFQLVAPWHFKARPDLVEELCLRETAAQFLPRSASTYHLWRKAMPNPASPQTYEGFVTSRRNGYEPSRRLVLQPVVLDRESSYTGAIVDARGWWVAVPFEGLYHSVFLRAAELICLHGMNADQYGRLLDPKLAPVAAEGWKVAPLAIGYDWGTGRCALLASQNPQSLGAFLRGGPWRSVSLKHQSNRSD